MNSLTYEQIWAYLRNLNPEQQELPECVAPVANAIRSGRVAARWADLSEDRHRNLVARCISGEAEDEEILVVDSQHLSWIGLASATPAWIAAYVDCNIDARARLVAATAITTFRVQMVKLLRAADAGETLDHVQARYEPSTGFTLALTAGGNWGYNCGHLDYVRTWDDPKIVVEAKAALAWDRQRQRAA